MQLKQKQAKIKSGNIRKTLSAATSALLGSTSLVTGSVAADTNQLLEEGEWKFDTAILMYSESDGRVTALEPVLKAQRGLANEEQLSFKLVFDSLTGASPTGAVPSSRAQTFTGPSGNGSYGVAAGEVPLDTSFLDTRVALSTNWEKPLSRLSKLNLGANVSSEYDFESLGFNATYSHDFNNRNTTLTTGIAFESDGIDPVGGVPRPLTSAMIAPGLPQNRLEDSDSRDLVDLLFGWTQIVNRKTVMQFNLSFSQSDGYHNDPYKMISIVDDTVGPNLGEPVNNIFENRPDSRSKTAIFWRTLYSLDQDVVDISYRFLTDDWGIESNTVDFRYKWMQQGGSYWEPHLRLYQQTAADFYRTLLTTSDPIPAEISADYRLGDLQGTTVGIKYSMSTQSGNRMEFRLELLMQTNDPSLGSTIGVQANQEQILDTNAVIFQFNYSF